MEKREFHIIAETGIHARPATLANGLLDLNHTTKTG